MFRVGDIVLVEYIKDEWLKGIIVSIEGERATVKIGVNSRKTKSLYVNEIEIELSKIKAIA